MSLRRGLAVVVAFALAGSLCSAAAAPVAVSASASAQPTAKPRPSLYVATGGEPYQVFAAPRFPKVIWVSEHDDLTGLTWKGAGQQTATATGIFNHDDCLPNCALGSYRHYAIKLTAADPEWCRVKLDNRESARPVYVYDTITTRGTAGRLPVWPYFKRACP
jgi:hypothetical protein